MSIRLPTLYERKGRLNITAVGLDGLSDWEVARWLAIVEINSTRAMCRHTLPEQERETIAARFDTHPDRKVIDQWLHALSPIDGVAKLRSNLEYRVIYYLSVHTLSEWRDIPKMTNQEHRKLYSGICATLEVLRNQLNQTGDTYIRGGGYGLQDAMVSDFLTEKEEESILGPIEFWNEQHPDEIDGDDGPPLMKRPDADFPSLDDLLGRVASAAKRLQEKGPIHSQPNKRGAMNGYFIRRMDSLLRGRYGQYPADVLAAIATIALDSTIDADLVQKTVALSERSSKGKA